MIIKYFDPLVLSTGNLLYPLKKFKTLALSEEKSLEPLAKCQNIFLKC